MSALPLLRWELRPGTYYDSLVLMQLQRALAEQPGVLDAGIVMATLANLKLLAAGELLPPDLGTVRPDDLLVVVRAEGETAAEEALARIDGLLDERRSFAAGRYRPRSVRAALAQLPAARWVLVSVPGRYAAGVARDALDAGRHVFLYSDNVALDEEVELKRIAAERGLLVMGPDCGTAMIGGVGLGFVNRVRRGGIGLVAASGTGLQAVMTRIHALGAGVSHAIGTGGRDLSSAVGATSALQALDLLGRDPDTQVIALIAKPPDAAAAARVLAAAPSTGKPVVVDFQGSRVTGDLAPVRFAATLEEAAELAVALAEDGGGAGAGQGRAAGGAHEMPAARAVAAERDGSRAPDPRRGADQEATGAVGASERGFVRGLFSGGTLAIEALLGLRGRISPLYSNTPMAGVEPLEPVSRSRGHTILDLGADEFTVGRPHPILDPTLRIERLRQEAADLEVAILLLDVVLGLGAHADPAAALAPAIAEVRAAERSGRTLDVVVILIGTEEDPQDLGAQESALAAAGARVVHGVGEAVRYTAARLGVEQQARAEQAPATELAAVRVTAAPRPVPLDALAAPFAAVNVGLEAFHDALVAQGAEVIHVDWRPPAGGDERLAAILARLKSR